MEHCDLQAYISQHKSIAELAAIFTTSKSNIRYWLKKYKLKTRQIKRNINMKICPKCKITKDKFKFYNRRNKRGNSVYCRQCSLQQVIDRQQKFKKQCIIYKGGKCSICGYIRCDRALKFHHMDASKKSFEINRVRLTKFGEVVKKELDKCILVCGNCHDEIHSGLIKIGAQGGS